jgi:23S rRNA pseudouridine955/2504/2580 synthase
MAAASGMPPGLCYDALMSSETAYSEVRRRAVDSAEAGQRIDNFLLRELKGVPKSLVYRILRRGEVRVNRGRIRPDYRLQAGDVVRIPPLRQASPDDPVHVPDALARRLDAAILHEDARLLVVNKPAGLAVHGGSGLAFGLIEVLRVLRPDAPFLELVHRLDRETSGCLMLAKSREALLALHEALRAGQVQKRYLALLGGDWRGGARTVDVPLEKTVRGGEHHMAPGEEGKEALTRFRPIERYRGATLVEAGIATGRTHQIRVHAAHIGHPLAGDTRYGDEDFNHRMRALGLKRHFLHAHSLDCPQPGGDSLLVSAPLDAELGAVLDGLGRAA